MQKETSFPQKQKPLEFYFRGLFHFLFREIYSSGASSSTNSTLSNPEIIILDDRIRRLDAIVTEVKQSEEWEDVHMSILSTGIDIGRKVGHEEGLEEGRKEGRLEGIHAIINVLREHGLTDSEIIQQLCKSFRLDTGTAEKMFHDFSNHD